MKQKSQSQFTTLLSSSRNVTNDDRCRMRQYVEGYLQSRTSSEKLSQYKHRFPKMAARLEQLLFLQATSMEEYINLRTLHNRLKMIASSAPKLSSFCGTQCQRSSLRVNSRVKKVTVRITTAPNAPVFICERETS